MSATKNELESSFFPTSIIVVIKLEGEKKSNIINNNKTATPLSEAETL